MISRASSPTSGVQRFSASRRDQLYGRDECPHPAGITGDQWQVSPVTGSASFPTRPVPPARIRVCERAAGYVFALLLLAWIVGWLSNAAFAQSSLTNGWIAYWNFDDSTAKDSNGKEHDGTVSGAMPTNGVSGGGKFFDGVDDYIEVPNTGGVFNLRARLKTPSLLEITPVFEA